MTVKKILLKLLLLAAACAFLFGCSKDDDSGNNNCPQPGSIVIDELNSASVRFSWGVNDQTAWEIEIGPTGFSLGNGTVFRTSEIQFFIDGLDPETNYDLYMRSNCGSEGFSSYISTQFVTAVAVPDCNQPTDLFLADLGSDFIGIGWSENNETAWVVEYGLVGFELGTGETLSTSQSTVTIPNLNPSTTYEIYVRANCGSEGLSEYSDAIVITTND